jgi:GNAT superfamily N-acetyltransferase
MNPVFEHRTYLLPSCQLVPLQPTDITIISEQLAEMHPWQSMNYSVATLANYLQRKDACLYQFAIVTEHLAGVLCVRYPWLRGAYIELVAIFPTQQRAGIGHDLIQWLTIQLNSNANLWALVSRINPKARQFYQQEGFIEIGELQDFVFEGFDEILLRKPLSTPRAR